MLDGRSLNLGATTPYVVMRPDVGNRKLNEGLVPSLFVADRDENSKELVLRSEPSPAGLALADRLQWLATRTGGQRALATAAFGPSGATKISNLVSRLRAGIAHGMHSDTLAAIVSAAHQRGQPIESEWLRVGTEPQFVAEIVEPTRVVAYDDPHPNRPAALAILRGLVDVETLEAVRSMATKAEKTITVDGWVDIGVDLQRSRNRARVELESARQPLPAPRVSAPELAAARLRGKRKR